MNRAFLPNNSIANICIEHYEHIAGPSCKNKVGYNGNNITAEEMQDCNTFQCLVPRRNGWLAEPHDQDFESPRSFDPVLDTEGFDDWNKWNNNHPPPFLSGLGSIMSDRPPKVVPARHGAREIVERDAMPFHPTCFDIMQRVWRVQIGGPLDVYTLARWCSVEVREPNIWAIPPGMKYHPDVRKSYGDKWDHIRGLEYLAANPLFITRLRPILKAAIQDDPSFSTSSGAFSDFEGNAKHSSTQESQDIFASLPQELGLQILFHLEPKDVASLRLVSRAFRQIPIYFWRHLLLKEMPWLWEAWSDDEPYLWATVPFAMLEEEQDELEILKDQCEQYREAIRIEMPEVLSDWIAAEECMLAARPDVVAKCYAEGKKKLMIHLPIDKTNWFQLYANITKYWDDLKGLQNRKRIWAECEGIVDFLMWAEFAARH
jgi:hypothetical protein